MRVLGVLAGIPALTVGIGTTNAAAAGGSGGVHVVFNGVTIIDIGAGSATATAGNTAIAIGGSTATATSSGAGNVAIALRGSTASTPDTTGTGNVVLAINNSSATMFTSPASYSSNNNLSAVNNSKVHIDQDGSNNVFLASDSSTIDAQFAAQNNVTVMNHSTVGINRSTGEIIRAIGNSNASSGFSSGNTLTAMNFSTASVGSRFFPSTSNTVTALNTSTVGVLGGDKNTITATNNSQVDSEMQSGQTIRVNNGVPMARGAGAAPAVRSAAAGNRRGVAAANAARSQ